MRGRPHFRRGGEWLHLNEVDVTRLTIAIDFEGDRETTVRIDNREANVSSRFIERLVECRAVIGQRKSNLVRCVRKTGRLDTHARGWSRLSRTWTQVGGKTNSTLMVGIAGFICF